MKKQFTQINITHSHIVSSLGLLTGSVYLLSHTSQTVKHQKQFVVSCVWLCSSLYAFNTDITYWNFARVGIRIISSLQGRVGFSNLSKYFLKLECFFVLCWFLVMWKPKASCSKHQLNQSWDGKPESLCRGVLKTHIPAFYLRWCLKIIIQNLKFQTLENAWWTNILSCNVTYQILIHPIRKSLVSFNIAIPWPYNTVIFLLLRNVFPVLR